MVLSNTGRCHSRGRHTSLGPARAPKSLGLVIQGVHILAAMEVRMLTNTHEIKILGASLSSAARELSGKVQTDVHV